MLNFHVVLPEAGDKDIIFNAVACYLRNLFTQDKANNSQQSWEFGGEPPKVVISDMLQKIGLYEAP
ncbi:MAG: hypothetical protein EB059_10090, partial [Alphaproteobacteria bacterium]|nr:hypothetical protein [Alphaproteobacteria bacterium]